MFDEKSPLYKVFSDNIVKYFHFLFQVFNEMKNLNFEIVLIVSRGVEEVMRVRGSVSR